MMLFTLNVLAEMLTPVFSSLFAYLAENLINAAAPWLVIGILPPVVKTLLILLVDVYTVVVIVWALLSWIDHSRGFLNDLYEALDRLVSPYVGLFRRFIRPMGGLDFSSMVALLVLQFVIRLIVRVL